MTLNKFLNPNNDLAFKRIFGTEKNKDILIHFLNDIFGRTDNPIEKVTLLKTHQEPEIAAQRESIVDVMCEDLEKNKFIVEMQVGKEKGYIQRAHYYAAKAYIEQRDRKTDYMDLKSVTFLAITEFVLFPQKKKYLSHHQMIDVETYEHDLKDFSFSFLELPKFKKSKDDLMTMTEKWAYFFKYAERTTEKDLADIVGDDLIMQKAYEELNRFGWTKEELRLYDKVEMKNASNRAVIEQSFDDGLAKGLAEGRILERQKMIETIRKEGVSEDIIQKMMQCEA